jgi:hypothetical protein
VTTDERIDRLTGIVESLASTVVAHDNQIEALIKIAEKHDEQLAKQGERIDSLVRQWQAYLTRIAPV